MRARRASLAALAAVALLPACSYQGVSTDDTTFACAPVSEACPPGHVCVGGLCVESEDDGPDARISDVPDGASLADASPASDAASPADAAPAPDAAPSATTLIFGDNSIATVRGTFVDTFLAEDEPNDGHGSAQLISVDAGPRRFGLQQIDVSRIPRGSTVESAQIVLNLADPVEDGRIEAQVLREGWDEQAATFNRADFNDPWSTAGAGGSAVVSTVIASFEGRTANTDVVIDLPAAVVQLWVDVPATNFGIRWRSTSPTERGGQWHSSESGAANSRPYLRVTFRPAT
jgi:hypothetical protein